MLRIKVYVEGNVKCRVETRGEQSVPLSTSAPSFTQWPPWKSLIIPGDVQSIGTRRWDILREELECQYNQARINDDENHAFAQHVEERESTESGWTKKSNEKATKQNQIN